jgi:uncharacterized membrane protein
MAEQKNDTDVRFWTSRKFWLEVIAAAVFVTMSLTDQVEFTPEQVLAFVLGLAGIAVGAHAATDIVSLITGALERRAQTQGEAVIRAAEVATNGGNRDPDPEETQPDSN